MRRSILSCATIWVAALSAGMWTGLWLRDSPPQENVQLTASHVFTEWLEQDQDAALAHLASMPPEHLPVDSGFYAMWCQADLENAASYLDSLPLSEPAAGFAETIGRHYGEAGRWQDGLAWSMNLPGARKHQAFSRLFDAIEPSGIPRALDTIATVAEASDRQILHTALFDPWLAHDREPAMEWLRQHTTPPYRQAMRTFVQWETNTNSQRRQRLLEALR